ncbi:MAG: hypothetical protein V7756_17780 [Halopseudomonas sp.]|uniref:tetratricopeptide repeat protein n=1 Tax=Halopseudomonas sp. TaxID=2901191 RepID=UPI003002BB4F
MRLRPVLLLLFLLAPVVQAQQIDPKVFMALESARTAQQSGDLRAAQRGLDEALKSTSADSLEQALVQQRLGYLAIEREEYAAAIRWLKLALAQDQLSAEAAQQDRRNLAQLLVQQGQYAEAVKLLEAEEVSGLPLATRRLLVQAYRELKQYRKAIPLAEQIVRANPAAEDIWYQLLAGMNYELRRYGDAVEWLQVLVRRAPERSDNWRQLASMQSMAGKQAEAAATLRLAHEGGVGLRAGDLDNLVALHAQAGAPWQAARLLDALIEQKLLPTDREHQLRLAQLWQAARDREQALSAWQQLARQSGDARYWLQVAYLQYQQDDWSGMQATLSQFRPGNAEQRRQVQSLRNAAAAAQAGL